MRRMTLVAVAAAIGWATPATAQMVKAQEPMTVLAAMQKAGYATAKLGIDKLGDPYIEAAVNGTTFQAFFYNCTDHKACATLQLHSGYDLDKTPTATLINSWNRTQRFGRAWLDDQGDPILEMDIDLDDGGMSSALFADNLEFWATIVAAFEKHIGYR